jgi:hypothetical protein
VASEAEMASIILFMSDDIRADTGGVQAPDVPARRPTGQRAGPTR